MHIGRSNVRRRYLRQQIVRNPGAGPFKPPLMLGKLLRRYRGWFGQEARLLQPQAARNVDTPWPRHPIGVGEPDVTALVVGEIEVVRPEPTGDPVGNPDRRR